MIKFSPLILICVLCNFLSAQETTPIPLVFGPSVVTEGELFEVQIVLTNVDRSEITSVDTEGEKSIEFKNGVAIIKFEANRTFMELSGTISVSHKGEEITKNWAHDVVAMKRMAKIGNDLPYLYRGLHNKIEALAIGFPATRVKGSGVAVTKKEGHYYARPAARMDTVSISVYGIQPSGDEIFIRKQKFVVLNLPAPVLSLNGVKVGDKVSLDSLLLEAKLDASSPISTDFKIESWEVFVNSESLKGNSKDLSSAQELIKSLKSGDHFSILCEVKRYGKLEKLSGIWFAK